MGAEPVPEAMQVEGSQGPGLVAAEAQELPMPEPGLVAAVAPGLVAAEAQELPMPEPGLVVAEAQELTELLPVESLASLLPEMPRYPVSLRPLSFECFLESHGYRNLNRELLQTVQTP
jgi:hypothetical protein